MTATHVPASERLAAWTVAAVRTRAPGSLGPAMVVIDERLREQMVHDRSVPRGVRSSVQGRRR